MLMIAGALQSGAGVVRSWRIARALGYGRVEGVAQGRASAGLSADPAAGLRGAGVLAVGRRRRADPRAGQSADARGARGALVRRCGHRASIFPRPRRRRCCCCWSSSRRSPRGRGERVAMLAGRALARARRAARRRDACVAVAHAAAWRRACGVARFRSSAWRCGRSLRSGAFPTALPEAWTLGELDAAASTAWPRRASRRWLSARSRRGSRWCSRAGLPRERKPRTAASRRRARAVDPLSAAAGAAGRVPVRRAGAAGARWARRDAAARRVGASGVRAAVRVPVAGRSVARARSALRAHGGEPRRVAVARVLRASSCRCCSPAADRVRRRHSP